MQTWAARFLITHAIYIDFGNEFHINCHIRGRFRTQYLYYSPEFLTICTKIIPIYKSVVVACQLYEVTTYLFANSSVITEKCKPLFVCVSGLDTRVKFFSSITLNDLSLQGFDRKYKIYLVFRIYSARQWLKYWPLIQKCYIRLPIIHI